MVKPTPKELEAIRRDFGETVYVRLDLPYRLENDRDTGEPFLTIPIPMFPLDCEEHWRAIEKSFHLTYSEMEDIVNYARRLVVGKYLTERIRL